MCVPPPSALHCNLTARFVMQMASRRRNDNRNDSRTRCDTTLGEMQPRLDRGAPPTSARRNQRANVLACLPMRRPLAPVLPFRLRRCTPARIVVI
ncbi:hypothetical protein CYME_CMM205C [Cyanidioschyzon merolae strain 10D]|uniref:Uncharacterized protein n=1 Tax=Cyanidioschyzon merolae (strain NIES-3377 / 10D) TaxID=280699 RepID=M1V8Y2_CYAM1|nr:hypothetical protein CYME_CMM205C [Cyanidioschyzon merolae strain 10D]BAM81054.1 hypothetical protein CYME_CMM205C [Cyanidioschyzon merolae strain 10D]|eukprot:XP_005537090.1 hypothetical protein CYME_CMM205C [Cyanidioschyzon merolae strain 10D]